MSLTMDTSDERASSVSEIRIEQSDVTDDELRRLSVYFEKGREEIQKKVDYLLSQEIRPTKVSPASSNGSIENGTSDTGGERNYKPINLEIATKLREFTVGSCVHSLSDEWKRGKFNFVASSLNDDLSYGLQTGKNGSRGLILSVQTILLKNFLLMGYKDIHGKDVSSSEWRNERKILKPTEVEKKDILAKTFAEILWKAGEMKFACFVIESYRIVFDAKNSGVNKSNYFADGLTEKLHLYEFNNFKTLEEFIKKNLTSLQKENGCILYLYSLILSRNFEKIRQDLQGSRLIGDMEECKMSLFNLVLTGTATPYLHNGSTFYNSQGESLTKPLVGIKTRNDVGILFFDPKEKDNARTEVGSMLKTPKYPIWLGIMGKYLMAILFNTNIDLVNDWRLEQNFSLHFYSGLNKQENDFKLDIISRNPLEITNQSSKNHLRSKYSNFNFFDDDQETEIIRLIKTKWPDCDITNTDGKDLMQMI